MFNIEQYSVQIIAGINEIFLPTAVVFFTYHTGNTRVLYTCWVYSWNPCIVFMIAVYMYYIYHLLFNIVQCIESVWCLHVHTQTSCLHLCSDAFNRCSCMWCVLVLCVATVWYTGFFFFHLQSTSNAPATSLNLNGMLPLTAESWDDSSRTSRLSRARMPACRYERWPLQ